VITSDQMTRLKNAIEMAATHGHQALMMWGPELQESKAKEECAELILELERSTQNRAASADIVLEAADVIITAIQVGLIHCNINRGNYQPEDLIDAIAEKATRLGMRVKRASEEKR